MLINPYAFISEIYGSWLKAGFHIHAGAPPGDVCGVLPPEEVIATYQDCGYDVLAITNHDFHTPLEEYRTKTSSLLMDGYEYTQAAHMVCIGTSKVIIGNHQQAIDDCNKDGVVIACHPLFSTTGHWQVERLLNLHDVSCMEVFNYVTYRCDGNGLASCFWDAILSSGKLIWGVANDDFHRWYDMNRAWNMVFAEKNQKSVVDALKTGQFYASTGLVLNQFLLEGRDIDISASESNGLIGDVRYILIGDNGRELESVTGCCASFTIPDGVSYARVHVTAPSGHSLWLQPVYEESAF